MGADVCDQCSNAPSQKYEILACADKKRYEEEKLRWAGAQNNEERESSRKRKRTEERTAPRKLMTPFAYWCMNERNVMLSRDPHMDKHELQRVLAEKWRAAPAEEKEVGAPWCACVVFMLFADVYGFNGSCG